MLMAQFNKWITLGWLHAPEPVRVVGLRYNDGEFEIKTEASPYWGTIDNFDIIDSYTTSEMKSVFGRIVNATKDERGLSFSIELNDKGKTFFDGLEEDYKNHLEILQTRINYQPPYSIKDFDVLGGNHAVDEHGGY